MNNIIKNEIIDMEVGIIGIITGFGAKICSALSTLGGFLGGCALALVAFLSPIKYLLLFIFIVTMVDLLLGVWINRKNILSSKLRLTVFKLFFYLGLLALCFGMEALVGISILYKIIFALISLTELISICSNALIINPNLKVIGLFKKLFVGEIAKKLETTKEEVEKVLNEKKGV